jgi:ribonuclease HI
MSEPRQSSAVLAIPRSRERSRTPGRYIDVDASFKGGLAGIAHAGLAGSHRYSVRCSSSMQAELRALLIAMAAAERLALSLVTFRTDCKVVAEGCAPGHETLAVVACLARHPSWRVLYVPRDRNVIAHKLARRALKEALDSRDAGLRGAA